MVKAVIVNADDFGLCREVNQAVAKAHRDGVVSSASLLLTGRALDQAVRLAMELPNLGVGLHLALSELPSLTGLPHPARHRDAFWRLLTGRVDPLALRDEIEAQLDAAFDTGLAIDHVDGHGHLHIVPAVMRWLAPACLARGITAIRWPVDPSFGPKCRLLAALARRAEPLAAGLARPVACHGIAGAGRMTWSRLLTIAERLSEGISEVSVHPATRDGAAYRGYRGAVELAALRNEALRVLLPARVTFAALSRPAAEG